MESRVICGRYQLIRVLGQGGMGSVWLAKHLSLGTTVAVKLLNSELANHPDARARFTREAQLAARIRSVHVVQVHDHGVTEEDEQFIVMEHLVGESLSKRLAARGRLSLLETAHIIAQTSRGVARAHAAGLVHRDLKPDNIFIVNEGDMQIVKVLDFGVAKPTDALSYTGLDPTRTGVMIGTPQYMSPEQAQGLKNIGTRSDLWSLGVVVFECITGIRPFESHALGPLISKIVEDPLPTPSLAEPDAMIPREVDAWMTRALERAPEQRFATAEELSAAFMIAAGYRPPS